MNGGNAVIGKGVTEQLPLKQGLEQRCIVYNFQQIINVKVQLPLKQ